jgi:putative peptidoglycan lipid II flippase
MEDVKQPEPSTAHAVARAGGIMVFALFLSRVLGLVRDTMMGAQFGIDNSTDAYRIAYTIPDMIFYLVAGGGLSSAFIPIFSEYLHTDRKEDSDRYFSAVLTITTILVGVLVVLGWIFAPQLAAFMAVDNLGRSKPPETIRLATLMSRIMLPMQVAFMAGSIVQGTLYAHKRYAVPAIAPNIYNIGIIMGGLILPRAFGFGIESMAWGGLVGAILGSLVIPLVSMSRLGVKFRPSVDLKAPGVARFFKLLLPMILGFSLPSVAALITQKFASGYGEGINTVMFYSTNLMQIPHGIFGQSLALAAFPVLAQFFAENRMDRYRDQVTKTLRTITLLAVPSSIMLFAMAPQVVHVLYGYGRAANAQELDLVAQSLRIFTLGIVAWAWQPTLMRAFFALQKSVKPVIVSTIFTAVFIGLCSGFAGSKLGFLILPWATNLAAISLTIALYLALEGEVGNLDRAGIFATLGKSCLASIPMGLIGWGGYQLWTPSGKLLDIVWFLILILAGTWSFYFGAKALKMPETDYFDRAFARMQRKA